MTIRDVIYDDITIDDPIIEKLIRTREFQRLRKIKQLGLSNYIYPCAEHSRYSHSVGVYHLGKEFVKVLEEKRGSHFSEIDKESFLVACLLHDIGHGPFSHAAEEFFKYDHEQMSVNIIANEETEINEILKEANIVVDVCKFIKKTHDNQLLIGLLSSSVDVDRMDYLHRDSYFCGVTYGKMDVGRILKIIDTDGDKIVFLEKGIHTIEDFLLSRYHMFTQVYLNKKSLGYETLIGEILKRMQVLKTQNYQFVTSFELLDNLFSENIDVTAYLRLDDFKMYSLIEELAANESDQQLVALANSFLNFDSLLIQEQPFDSDKFQWSSSPIRKTIYNPQEPIYIKTAGGDIRQLEEESKFVNFIKNQMAIELPKLYFMSNHD